jgi:NADH-quinone oxidoreductase subunit J
MVWSFAILALLTLGGAVAAMGLRNLVHCALALTLAFAGLAGLYLQLNAQFVGFAQILVYIGAVAILVVFAILLTRGSESPRQAIFSPTWFVGGGVAIVVFGLFAGVILSSQALPRHIPPAPQATVRQIGEQLMTKYVLPLEVMGLLLTAALIGAVIIGMQDKGEPPPNQPKARAQSKGEQGQAAGRDNGKVSNAFPRTLTPPAHSLTHSSNRP